MENIFKRKLNESLPVIDYDAEASVYDRAVREFSNQIDRNGKISLNDSELEVLVDYAIDYSGDENSREIAEKVRKVIENARYLKDKKLSAKDVHILLCDRDFYNYIDTIPVGASTEDIHTVYDMCLSLAKKSFFEDTGVYIYNAGESNKCLCVSNEYENALNYNELVDILEVVETDFGKNVNAELRSFYSDRQTDDLTTEELKSKVSEALGDRKLDGAKRIRCPQCGDEYTMWDVDANSNKVGDVGYHDLCICDSCGAELYAEPQYDMSIKWVNKYEDDDWNVKYESIDKKEIYKKVASDKKLAKYIAKITGKKTKEITDNAKKLAGEKNESLTKNKRTTLKESDDHSIMNDKGELKLNKTMIFHSKNGKQYFVRNSGGDYEVWVRKSVPAPGGTRLKDFFRDATQEIRNRVKLEQPQKSEGLKESLKEAKYCAYSGKKIEGEIYDFLDELGGYVDYDGKVDAVAEEFGMTKEEAESFVWDWSSAIDEDDFDDDLEEEDHESIVGWIEEHDQAYEDACSFFDTEDLSEVPLHDLIDWFADHKSLIRDIERHYGEPIVSKYLENGSLDESLKESFRAVSNDPYEILSLMADEVEGLVRDYGYGLSDSVDEVLRSWLTNDDTVYALAKHYRQFDTADVIKEIEDQLHSDLEYMARTGNWPPKNESLTEAKSSNKTFKVNLKDHKWKTAEFSVDGLSITPETVEYDDITLFLDGTEYDGSIATWAGRNLSASEIFEQTINSYLRNDSSDYEGFGAEWKAFDVIKNTAEYENGVCTQLPFVDVEDVKYYSLDLATNNYLFYTHDDELAVYDLDGGLVTDYEVFYMSALKDELKDIADGKTQCLYIDEYTKEWLESDEGKEFMEED